MASYPLNQIICSGGLFLARDTRRFLLLQRTQPKTAGSWGLVGGKKEPSDITAVDTLYREIFEEVGEIPKIKKIVPLELFVSTDQNFCYNTFVLIIDNEFTPTLNSEHSGYVWASYDSWPMPLHQGLKNSLNNKSIKAKLELLLKLL